MKLIELTINVPEDRVVTLTVPQDIVPGEHFTAMAIEQKASIEGIERDEFLERVKAMSALNQDEEKHQRAQIRRKLQASRPVQMWDNVALTEDMTAMDLRTDEPLIIRRGQQGSVVMTYKGKESEVEFESRHNHIYARLKLPNTKLLILLDAPESDA